MMRRRRRRSGRRVYDVATRVTQEILPGRRLRVDCGRALSRPAARTSTLLARRTGPFLSLPPGVRPGDPRRLVADLDRGPRFRPAAAGAVRCAGALPDDVAVPVVDAVDVVRRRRR